MELENCLPDDKETPGLLACIEYNKALRTYACDNLVMVQICIQWHKEYKCLNNSYIGKELDLDKAVDYTSNKEEK